MVCNKYVIKSDIKFLFWHFDALDFNKTALQLSHLVRCNSALLSNTDILIMQDYSPLNASLLDHSRICIYGYNCTVWQNFWTLPCPRSIEVDNDKYYNNSNF